MPIEYDPSRTALFTPEQRPTLFLPGHNYTPLQLGIEAARLAYCKTESSTTEAQKLQDALARVGFSSIKRFDNPETGTHAFGAWRAADSTALLAFRGTQPDDLLDLGTDADIQTVAWGIGAGSVHRGFRDAYLSVARDIEAWLRGECSARAQLILCGHSLGAALATLGASHWRPTLLVSLGGPRVGDAEFVRGLEGLNIARLVDCCDLVARVPPRLLGYAHPAAYTYIASDGRTHATPSDTFVDEDSDRARTLYLREQAWRRGTVLLRDLADHAPINYARAFFS